MHINLHQKLHQSTQQYRILAHLNLKLTHRVHQLLSVLFYQLMDAHCFYLTKLTLFLKMLVMVIVVIYVAVVVVAVGILLLFYVLVRDVAQLVGHAHALAVAVAIAVTPAVAVTETVTIAATALLYILLAEYADGNTIRLPHVLGRVHLGQLDKLQMIIVMYAGNVHLDPQPLAPPSHAHAHAHADSPSMQVHIKHTVPDSIILMMQPNLHRKLLIPNSKMTGGSCM